MQPVRAEVRVGGRGRGRGRGRGTGRDLVRVRVVTGLNFSEGKRSPEAHSRIQLPLHADPELPSCTGAIGSCCVLLDSSCPAGRGQRRMSLKGQSVLVANPSGCVVRGSVHSVQTGVC